MATESLTQAVRERLKSLEAQWLNNRKERARLAEEADQLMYAITVIKEARLSGLWLSPCRCHPSRGNVEPCRRSKTLE